MHENIISNTWLQIQQDYDHRWKRNEDLATQLLQIMSTYFIVAPALPIIAPHTGFGTISLTWFGFISWLLSFSPYLWSTNIWFDSKQSAEQIVSKLKKIYYKSFYLTDYLWKNKMESCQDFFDGTTKRDYPVRCPWEIFMIPGKLNSGTWLSLKLINGSAAFSNYWSCSYICDKESKAWFLRKVCKINMLSL